MNPKLKREVWKANLDLVKEGLVIQTWGNASGIDRSRGLMVIKPSGVAYERLKVADMAVVALDTGKVVQGKLRPSSDTPTHLALYRAFKEIGGVVHTHSLAATAWAQTRRALPAFGTTHADYFHGPVPCTRLLGSTEIQNVLEHLVRLAVETLRIFPSAKPLQQVLLDQHFFRKHGPGALYGQIQHEHKSRNQH